MLIVIARAADWRSKDCWRPRWLVLTGRWLVSHLLTNLSAFNETPITGPDQAGKCCRCWSDEQGELLNFDAYLQKPRRLVQIQGRKPSTSRAWGPRNHRQQSRLS